jgi:hypothetical protein
VWTSHAMSLEERKATWERAVVWLSQQSFTLAKLEAMWPSPKSAETSDWRIFVLCPVSLAGSGGG